MLALNSFTSSIAQTLTEGFETGLPNGGSGTVTNYQLASGTWSILKGAATSTKHTGAVGLKLSSGSSTPTFACAPALTGITTISFWAKGSSNTVVTIQKSVNGGAYTTIASLNITTTFTLYNVSVNETSSNVRMKLTNATSQTHYIDDVAITAGTATPTPVLAVNPSTLAFGDVAVNTTSGEKTYVVSGSSLVPASGTITVTAPAGYEISTTTGAGFSAGLSLPYTGSALTAKTVFVRFKPTNVQPYSGNITNAGGGAVTKNVTVSGTAVATGNTVTINFAGDTSSFHNPERGLYRYSIAKTSNYVTLKNTELQAIRNQKISLLFRYFVLDAFKTKALTQNILDSIQKDFNTVRSNGMKLIVRFSYVDDSDPSFAAPHYDAPKSIVLQHISQLKPLFQNNADVIYVLQAGFIGIWGEWYYTDYFGNADALTAQNIADRKAVTDSLLSAMPVSRMIALRTPKWKTTLYGYNIITDTLKRQEAFGTTAKARLAGHNDCFLADYNDYTFDDTATEKKYWAAESNYYSMGGESCNDDATYTNCSNALKELKRFHWSYINDGYHPGVLSRWKSNGCYAEIEKKIGYRYRLLQANIQNNALIGDSLYISLNIANDGWSGLVNKRKAELILKNNSDNSITKLPVTTGTIQLWLPAPTQIKTLALNCKIPSSLAAGSYSVYLNLPDDYASLASNKDYSIRLANLNSWETTTGYNLLYNNLVLTSTLSRSQGTAQSAIASSVRSAYIYPNPVRKGGTLYFSSMEGRSLKQTVKIFDLSGKLITQKTVVNNQLAIDINTGMYILCFQNKNGGGSYPLVIE
jgi:hypothetical protein